MEIKENTDAGASGLVKVIEDYFKQNYVAYLQTSVMLAKAIEKAEDENAKLFISRFFDIHKSFEHFFKEKLT